MVRKDGFKRLILSCIRTILDGVVVSALAREARGPGSVPVQGRILLLQFYNKPTDGLVLKNKFSILLR